jgi:diadenosine tetraphosphatase ApaH/serine/threonine PP2A family protein phosphatase
LAIAVEDGALAGGLAPQGTEADLGAGRLLLNPGSVGQPRDGDPRAAWLLLDFESQRASFRRSEYPVERTQGELRERGLPDALAERLARGL